MQEIARLCEKTLFHACLFHPGVFSPSHRLQSEATVTRLIRKVQHYMEERYHDNRPELLCRIYIRRIEHLYYKVGSDSAGGWDSASEYCT